MAVQRAKLTVFFGAVGGAAVPPTGWTETWYSLDTDYQTALDNIKGYAKLRRALLGVGATLSGFRVSDDAIKRDTLVEQLNGKDAEGNLFTTSPEDDHDPTQVDLVCRVEGGPLYRRSWLIAGLPDSVTDQLKTQGIGAAFAVAPSFKQIVTYLKEHRFCIKAKDKNAPFATILVPITNVIPRMIRNRKRGRPFDLFIGRRI